jgi:hypothetical protein
LVFLVVSFLLACPPIFYMHAYSPPFVLHAPPISKNKNIKKCTLTKKFFYLILFLFFLHLLVSGSLVNIFRPAHSN